MSKTELTENQRELKRQHRCIWCGQRVNKKYYGKDKSYYPEQCIDCLKSQHTEDNDGPYWGVGRASMRNEFARRMGVPVTEVDGDYNDND